MPSPWTSFSSACKHALLSSFTSTSLLTRLPPKTPSTLGKSDKHLGPTLDYMLDAGVLPCTIDMRKWNLLSGRHSCTYIAIANSPGLCPAGAVASPNCLSNVAYFQFATEPVWSQTPGSQTTNQLHPTITTSVSTWH
jgi:hypothetical protein